MDNEYLIIDGNGKSAGTILLSDIPYFGRKKMDNEYLVVDGNGKCIGSILSSNIPDFMKEARDKMDPDNNPISHPSHYVEGRKYEPKDVIRDWGLNFNLGCVVKYVSRAGRKDDILQDLEKAKQFLEFEMEAIKNEREKH